MKALKKMITQRGEQKLWVNKRKIEKQFTNFGKKE